MRTELFAPRATSIEHELSQSSVLLGGTDHTLHRLEILIELLIIGIFSDQEQTCHVQSHTHVFFPFRLIVLQPVMQLLALTVT